MARQLALIDARRSWQLSERTKEIGRRGIAEARLALAATRPNTDHDESAAHPGHPDAA